MTVSPRVTIGMPLYQNASTVSRAIRSLLDQTFGDFRLIASDDGSPDGTVEIVRELAREDSRVQLVQQPKNLNYGNFRYVLREAASPLFMFAAGDDYWDSEFLEACVHELDTHPEACCVVPQVQFFGADTLLIPGSGTYPLVGSVTRNLASFLRAPLDNSRMYGLFRTEMAQRAFPTRDHHAFDWTFSAASLRDGQHREIPWVLMHREATPSARYTDYVKRDNSAALDRLFPLLPMTRALVFEKRVPLSVGVIRALTRINIEHHLTYVNRYHPRYARYSAPTLTRLIAFL